MPTPLLINNLGLEEDIAGVQAWAGMQAGLWWGQAGAWIHNAGPTACCLDGMLGWSRFPIASAHAH